MSKDILVTGGTGYIGSHTVVELLNSGYRVVIVDNLSNSKASVVDCIVKITKKRPKFYMVDLLDDKQLGEVFDAHKFDAVIHFAGLKAVGESVEKPLEYYENNVVGTINLLKHVKRCSVCDFIFSSSATVYGDPGVVEYHEGLPTGQNVSSPYGQTKHAIERILVDKAKANPKLRVSLLRYFNPIGAHESGMIGEDPSGIPNNLLPYIAKVATGELEELRVFGNDYPTVDGTCVRDYIHVVDLAKGHLAALEHLSNGAHAYNLGSGRGTSVLEVVEAFSAACGHKIPHAIAPRRAGDLAEYYANPGKAKKELGWQTTKTITDACVDTWRWVKK